MMLSEPLVQRPVVISERFPNPKGQEVLDQDQAVIGKLLRQDPARMMKNVPLFTRSKNATRGCWHRY